MRLTKELTLQLFRRFNAEIFGCKLPEIPIVLKSSRSFLGQILYKRKRQPDGSWRFEDFTLAVSTRLDLPERMVEDIIIHEMIHLQILSNQLQDTSPHGRLFRAVMDKINREHDRNVTISVKTTSEQSLTDRKVQNHILIIIKTERGEYALIPAVKTALREILDQLKHLPASSWLICVSRNPYFNQFRRKKSASGYILERELLQTELSSARLLLRHGSLLRPSGPVDLGELSV